MEDQATGVDVVDLPPGFRFHPTDEEIITCYLTEKVINSSFSAIAIGEADLNKCEPWDLPQKAKMGEKEWYFFCQRDRKYPTGMRTNRATEAGYWKATGKDKEIFQGKSCLAGMKKTLVFYKGRAPKGEKTNWVMHEYRLEGKFHLPKSAKDEWVVCRIFHKNATAAGGMKRVQIQDCSSILPPLVDPSYNHATVETGGGFDDGVLRSRSSAARSIRSADHEGYYQLKYFSIDGANERYFRSSMKPQIGSFSQLPPNNYATDRSSADGMVLNISQRSNNPSFSYPEMGPVPADRFCNFSLQKMNCYLYEEEEDEAAMRSSPSPAAPVEQLSSMVSVSHETGLSTADMNAAAEISSGNTARRMPSSNGTACYDGTAIGVDPIADLDHLWEY